jgi:predicted RNase H-like nuclease (RuvC/YqgF family)
MQKNTKTVAQRFHNVGNQGYSRFGFMPTILMEQENGNGGGNAPPPPETPPVDPKETKPFKSFATETEYKNYISAKTSEAVTAAINKNTGETAQRLENDIFEATGLEKQEGEKYHQYLKRSIETLKTGKNTDQEILKNLEQQKQSYESKISQYEKDLQDLRNENILSKKQNAINSSLPKNLKDDVLAKTYLESVVNEVKGFEHIDSDGSILLKKGDTFVKDENGNPYTLQNYLNEKVKIIQIETPLQGTNAGKDQQAKKSVNTLGIVVGNVENIDQLSTKMREEAIKKGTNPNTKEFASQIFAEAKERGFVK